MKTKICEEASALRETSSPTKLYSRLYRARVEPYATKKVIYFNPLSKERGQCSGC